MFDTPMVTTMNFRVSTAPQRRSKYLRDAGMVSNVNKSYTMLSVSVLDLRRGTYLEHARLHQRRRYECPGIKYTLSRDEYEIWRSESFIPGPP